MTPESLPLEVLQQIPLFAGMTANECQQMANISLVTKYEAGEVILRQGKSTRNLWIVLDGSCEVIKYLDGAEDKPTVLAEFGLYCNFGEMSFFEDRPQSATVRAKTPMMLLQIRREAFDALAEQAEGAAYKLALNAITSLAQRLRQMSEWVAKLSAAAPAEAERVPEWSQLRERLFDKWNL